MIFVAYIYPAWTLCTAIVIIIMLSIMIRKDHLRRNRLLSIGDTSDPSESELWPLLSTLNATSNDRMFSLSCHSVVAFRGHRLVLIWGDIGGRTSTPHGLLWTVAKNLYVLGFASDREWLCQQTDVLKEIARGKDCSLFWITDLNMLEKDIRKLPTTIKPPVAQGQSGS